MAMQPNVFRLLWGLRYMYSQWSPPYFGELDALSIMLSLVSSVTIYCLTTLWTQYDRNYF